MEKKSKNNKKNKKNNKTKDFTYYGVHLFEETEKKLLSMVQKGIDSIFSSYKEDFKEIYDTLSELIKKYDAPEKDNTYISVNKMSYPKSLHITIAFGGRKGFDKNSKAYKNFEPGKEVNFTPVGIVVLPGKSVVTMVFTDAEIENKIPHITTFLGSYSPVKSNNILEELFEKDMPLEKEFENLKEGKCDGYVNKLRTKILEEEQDVYVFFTNKNENLQGRMKGYYY